MFLAFFAIDPVGGLRVSVLDVGQGDAIFFRTPGGYNGLVDGGSGRAVLENLGKQMPFFDKKIDVMILTHPHRDHIEGLLDVLERYQVGLIVHTDVSYESFYYEKFRELARGHAVLLAEKGSDIVFGDGTVLDILMPFKSLAGETVQDVNASSVVARLSYAGKSFLLSGDMTAFEEKELILSSADFKSDVLKIAHHGSKTSSSESFLRVVQPDLALISAGTENKFGHPHDSVISRLSALGIDFLRTDLSADINLNSFDIGTEET